MSFKLESQMTVPVRRWLHSRGLRTRTEYAAPWGICDVVGVELDPVRVGERLQLGQTRTIGPLERVALLRRIPGSARRAVSRESLRRDFAGRLPPAALDRHLERLIADRFVIATPSGALRRVDGWVPLHSRIVAVELKLGRFAEVLRQAAANRSFADESFVALPAEAARRLASERGLAPFARLGVGVLAVSGDGCEVLVNPRRARRWRSRETQIHCVEQFWKHRQ